MMNVFQSLVVFDLTDIQYISERQYADYRAVLRHSKDPQQLYMYDDDDDIDNFSLKIILLVRLQVKLLL